MRDEALEIAAGTDDPSAKLNLLREYIQACVLRSLHESEAFSAMAFVGGTALRFLENLPRFSEDLDFSLETPQAYDPERWLVKVRRDLELAGFEARVTLNRRKTVNVSWIRVAGLMKAAGLSDLAEQNVSIKLEVDTRPPAGAEVLRTVVTRHVPFVLCHYGLSSLMAGKIHALLTRAYPKGRDWFDLVWYRSRRPPTEPNVRLLQNALDQTQGEGQLEASAWGSLLRGRLEQLDPKELARDVSVFLERGADRSLLTRPNLEAVLRDVSAVG